MAAPAISAAGIAAAVPITEETDSPRGALAALGVIVVLVLGGLWLMRTLSGAAAVQDCVAAGRTNCAPVSASRP